ncbi:phosphorylcholine metabolism protein LicD [Ilumatobacter fluminis]|uniref:Phosphorylcholine metabolism protein LicD n=1 Tax=Ilumatobacter fluminis TaxID=467091 RepID=A0A4R7I3Q8_9ACTN|nr:glycosyltransferase [Ilumatobacter fluminis]TDT17306.1 phosphorylcholine metabolism protein LicD [Ilumatobacter fluminis]
MHPEHSDTPAVSVIVAAYNVESYIQQCLVSLKEQTLQSIEIIVVDDGSTDSTPDLIAELAGGDGHPISCIRRENGGLSAARNTGMAAASGRYVGFVDADDWVVPEMFEKLYARALETSSEVVVCAAIKRSGNKKRGRVRLRIPVEEFGVSVSENPEILWGSHSYAWNKIYARPLLERESFEFPPGKLFEDSSAVYGLIARANRVEAVDEGLYQYRVGRPDAITRRADPRIYDIFDSCESFRVSLSSIESVAESDVMERLARTHLLARLPVMRTSKSPLRSARFTRDVFAYLDEHYPGWGSRYDRGRQSRRRYWARRSSGIAVAVSFARPVQRVIRSGYRRLTSPIRRRSDSMRADLRTAAALRRVDRALRAASIPYTLDLSSLEQANEHQRLSGRLEIAVLPGEYELGDVSIALRQQRFRLIRSYVHDDRCFAQRWRVRRRFLGATLVEVRYLATEPDGSTKTRFFFRDSGGNDGVAANEGAVAELHSVAPRPVVDRRVALAGPVRAVEPSDPFAATRTAPDFARPRDFEQLATTLPDVVIADEPGCFYDGMPPIDPSLADRARVEQMSILRRLLEFCESEGLQPMLGDGSLLGAVRHGGYIPWDDDIDLWMTRPDFERLVTSQMPDGLAVLHHTTNRRFHLPFAKVVHLDSVFEWSFPADLDPAGANVDIFPLDSSASPEYLQERLRARAVRFLRQVLRAKYRFPEANRRLSRILIGRLLPGYCWHRILNAVVTARLPRRPTNVTSWFSAYPPRRASYPVAWMLPPTTLQFESVEVAAPRDPRRVLTRTYNDYEGLPPAAKRTTANHFLKIRGDRR